MRKILFQIGVLLVLIVPVLSVGGFFSTPTVFAQGKTYAIPIPCEGVKNVNGKLVQDCDLGDVLKLVSNVISFALLLSITVTTFIIAWCGWKILLAGSSSSELSKAKERLEKVLWGFFFSLTAWLIVKLITEALLKPGSYLDIFGN